MPDILCLAHTLSVPQAFAIMEEELGQPLGAVFSSISERPIAAASLGQVHAGPHHSSVLQSFSLLSLAATVLYGLGCLGMQSICMLWGGWLGVAAVRGLPLATHS